MKSLFEYFAPAGKRTARDPAIDHHLALFHQAAEKLDAGLGRRCGMEELLLLVAEVFRCQTSLIRAFSGEYDPVSFD